ncbi:MAG TPA: SufE family protein [Aggregatilineaceae bacterium]|nr:SufE family protein [Aggregatilineaceae bacterium]
MPDYPPKLQELLDDFSFITTREERADYLIDIAERFQPVPDRIATRPYPPECKVNFCESEAYVWVEPLPDGALKFYFAVENPQGVSAKAMAVILDETLSGAPLSQVAQVPPEIVLQIFGREISMGKGQGLMGMVSAVQNAAKQHLAKP